MGLTYGILFTLIIRLLIVKGSEELLSGFHFLDNELETRFGPDNGHATYNTGIPIPDQVGC